MKAFAMLSIGKVGWIDKPMPVCGPLDAIVKPIALAPCTSDVHTVWAGAIGDRHNLTLGHEAVGEIVEVGSLNNAIFIKNTINIQKKLNSILTKTTW